LTESESALVAALAVIGRLPGAEVRVEPDVTFVAAARPLAGLNHVLRLDAHGDETALEAAIDRIDAALRATGSVPATWWVGPSTRPADLGLRLGTRGFTEADPEYGMVIDVAVAAPPTADAELVEDAAEIDAFLEVMAGAYGWPDDGRDNAWAELYRLPLDPAERPWWHVVIRLGHRPAACASLFAVGGHAFVTNVGTIPEARGKGLGTNATLAVLAIARQLGFRRATLTASLMGRGVYARIGFREEARLDRWISPSPRR
jgi:GNAT superfamily N-acetyltransferase